MLQNFLSSFLSGKASNDINLTRRSYPRREADRCICTVQGQTLPVENWSFGGVLLSADERLFGLDQNVAVTIKFRLRNAIKEVSIHGRVLRKSQGRVAVQFEPLTQTIRRNFQQVIDDQVAREFANSQVTV
jgi:hypothetical protein